MKSKQSGFTLVEIAIVLVIVGLLLGGVLKGQELITSGKAKALYADKAAIQTAYNMYNDRFRAVPGDDLAASTRFTGLACGVAGQGASAAIVSTLTCKNGNGDGALGNLGQAFRITPASAAAIDDTSVVLRGANEALKFWQHLRAAQLIKTEGTGTGEAFYNPTNAAGGWTAINSAILFTGQQPSALFFTQYAVPGNIAGALDAANDDGFINRGGIRGQNNGGANTPNTDLNGIAYPATNAAVSTNLL